MVGKWLDSDIIRPVMDFRSAPRLATIFVISFLAFATSFDVAVFIVAGDVTSNDFRLGALLALAFAAGFTLLSARTHADEQQREAQIRSLEKRAEAEPEKAKPAWDLARATLEKYFQRNLNQVRMIFYAAIFVMLVGFGFVLWGVRAAVLNPNQVKIAIIASASGVITQFIGLTFMAIYRSTMLQATQYMSILERINTVGMAVQILDSMGDSNTELKDTTRVDIIRLLLAPPTAQMSFTPRKRKPVNAQEKPVNAQEKPVNAQEKPVS